LTYSLKTLLILTLRAFDHSAETTARSASLLLDQRDHLHMIHTKMHLKKLQVPREDLSICAPFCFSHEIDILPQAIEKNLPKGAVRKKDSTLNVKKAKMTPDFAL